MVQIIPQKPGFGAAFGQGLGEGVSSGMETLATQFQKHKQDKAFSEYMDKMPEDITSEEKMIYIMKSPANDDMKKTAITGLQNLEKNKQRMNILKGVGIITEEDMQPTSGDSEEISFENKSFGEEKVEKGTIEDVSKKQQQKPFEERDFTPEQIMAVSTVDPNLAKLMMEQKKMNEARSIQSQKNITDSFKETKEYRSDVNNQYKAYLEDKMMLDRMAELNEKDLASPFQATVSKFIGIPISILSNPESEEFEKLTASMTRNIKQYYGARITNLEMSTFLRSIPSLMNSSEGRDRVMKGLSIINKPKELEYQIKKDIMKEYEGRPLPYDMQDKVTEKMEDKLNKLSTEFSNISYGKVVVVSPEGKRYTLPADQAKKAENEGWTVEK
jgi:hypothetical protein